MFWSRAWITTHDNFQSTQYRELASLHIYIYNVYEIAFNQHSIYLSITLSLSISIYHSIHHSITRSINRSYIDNTQPSSSSALLLPPLNQLCIFFLVRRKNNHTYDIQVDDNQAQHQAQHLDTRVEKELYRKIPLAQIRLRQSATFTSWCKMMMMHPDTIPSRHVRFRKGFNWIV